MKIRQIYNFIGNKILNAKVNTPTDNEHIASKGYVDANDTYDTTLSQKSVSTKFNWVTNVNNLKIKAVLDKLLYPVVNPVYVNPTFDMNIFSLNTDAFIEDETVQGRLIYDIKNPDRNILATKTILTITDINNVATTFQSADTILNGFIEFELKVNKIQQVKITKEFGIAIVKNDSDGNPFIDNNFNTNYTLTKTFTKDQFVSELHLHKILPTIYHIGNFDKTNIQTFLDKNVSEFANTVDFTLATYSDVEPLKSTYLILIHPALLNEQFMVRGYNLQNEMVSITIPVDFAYHLLLKPDNTKYFKTINNVDHYAIIVDFGKNVATRKMTLNII